jgi:hypothetical protein
MVDAIWVFSNIYHIQHSVFIASQIHFPICKPEKTVHNRVKGLSGTFLGGCHLLPFTVPTKSPKAFEPLVPGEKPSLLEAPQAFIRAPWLELSNPFFLGVTWLNISISHVPWATSFWPQFLGNCVFAKANGWLPKEIGTSKSLSSPKTTWWDISTLFVLSWSSFPP